MAKLNPFKAIAIAFEILGKVTQGDAALDWIRENQPADGEDLVIPSEHVGPFYKTMKPLLKLAEKFEPDSE